MPKSNPGKVTRAANGQYRRQNLGKKRTEGGKLTPATFYLGTNQDRALRHSLRLEEAWGLVVQSWERRGGVGEPFWGEAEYQIASAVGHGKPSVCVKATDEVAYALENEESGEALYSLQCWLAELRALFPMIEVRFNDEATEDLAHDTVDHVYREARHREETAVAEVRELEGVLSKPERGGKRLFDALDAYAEFCVKKFGRAGYGRTVQKEIACLKVHTDDIPLSGLNSVRMETWEDHFAKRPEGKRGQLSRRYCINLIKRIRMFLRFLNKSDDFTCTKPNGYEAPPIDVAKTSAERARKVNEQQVQTYTLEELCVLYEYAREWERLFMLLALNCGWAQAEIATFQNDEYLIDRAHPNFGTVGSWVRKLRTKTDVYGEWKLWGATVRAIRYAERIRPKSTFTELILDGNGGRLTEPTKGGNRNNTIANAWGRLLKRVRKDHPDFKYLGFKYLKKTAGSMVRAEYGGEIANMYTFHGNVIGDGIIEVYANKPYQRLHEACEWFEGHLKPMFDRVADPFLSDAPARRSVISIGTIKMIKSLRGDRKTVSEIARELGISTTTVRRYAGCGS